MATYKVKRHKINYRTTRSPWMKKKSKNQEEKEEIQVCTDNYNKIDSSNIIFFSDFPLCSKTALALRENSYISPTEIQRESIGFALQGSDILGAAKTGSGKTLAFMVPVLECLYRLQWSHIDGLGALIISPTRELAYQSFEILKKIGKYHSFSAGLIIGGRNPRYEVKRINATNIIICTPGRLLQHMDENHNFTCDNLKILVIDEADCILDLGFQETVNAIIANLPKSRQTLLFSATQTKSVKDLVRLSLKDPIYVSVHEHAKYSTPNNLIQSYITCELHEKIDILWSFIKNHLKKKMLVFFSSCKQVKYMSDSFCHLRAGISVLALHGDMPQGRRMDVYESFCRKQFAVLFATDIAARGLDFPAVHWVIQYDCPEDVNTYIHRVGRTARYESNGEALLILLPSEEEKMISDITHKKIPINKIKINPRHLTSIGKKLETMCAQFNTSKECAQRAFKSYIKSVYLMKDKQIFDIQNLDFENFALSLGLIIPPRVRFIDRRYKQGRQNNFENLSSIIPYKPVSEKNSVLSDKESKSSDDEILIPKRLSAAASSALEKDLEITNKKKPKIITKVALAKKLLNQKVKPNIKILYDEDGDIVETFNENQMPCKYEKFDKNESGINIEISRKIMEEEDKIDKFVYQQRVKALHRERKLIEKMKRDQEKEETTVYLGFGDGELDIQKNSDNEKSENSEDSESEKIENEVDSSESEDIGLKYKLSQVERPRKKFKAEHNNQDDKGIDLTLAETEELALRLLE